MVVRSSQKEAALPAKGSNSAAAKDKTLIKHQDTSNETGTTATTMHKHSGCC
jgi:hypothetical protein